MTLSLLALSSKLFSLKDLDLVLPNTMSLYPCLNVEWWFKIRDAKFNEGPKNVYSIKIYLHMEIHEGRFNGRYMPCYNIALLVRLNPK